MAGPDHRASANPNEFKEMVKLIRLTENARKWKKIPTHIEVKNKIFARKSLVAKRILKKVKIL